MAAFPPTIHVEVDTDQFVRTRNALTSAYIGLSSAIDTAIKAYIAHTDVVLQGAGSFDISQLILPFQGAASAAQIAEHAIKNGLTQVASHAFDAHGTPGDVKKKEKRPYKPRDPNAPKRPLTAYFRFLREVRPLIAQEVAKSPPSEGTKAGDISKIATERWKAMTDAQRQPYHQAYQGEMGAYAEATKAYKALGGHIEDDAASPDFDAESPSALPVNGATPGPEEEGSDSSSASEEDSSSDEDADDEEEAVAPARLPTPPPPPKVEKKTLKPKKVKAAADAAPAVPFNNLAANHNIDPQLTDATAVAHGAAVATPGPSHQLSTASKKRKAAPETPGTVERGEKRKRGRPSKEDVAQQVAIAAQLQQHQHMAESSQAEMTSGTEKKKKKKRKSEAAGTV